MKCPAAKELIEAYVDGELDATQKADVRGHLESCISCAETHWQLMEMRTNIQNEAPYYQAPEHLRPRIAASLRKEAGQSWGSWELPWKWIATAASVLLAVSIGWNVQMLRSGRVGPEAADSEILSSHLRSLTGDHLVDVPSTDQHTVKPWFNGKVDFSPAVKDLASQGYPLVGGRVEYIHEKPAAVLVYRRRAHVINLFTWPGTGGGVQLERQRRGYNLIEWTKGDMTNWAVSDLNLAELRDFVRLVSSN